MFYTLRSQQKIIKRNPFWGCQESNPGHLINKSSSSLVRSAPSLKKRGGANLEWPGIELPPPPIISSQQTLESFVPATSVKYLTPDFLNLSVNLGSSFEYLEMELFDLTAPRNSFTFCIVCVTVYNSELSSVNFYRTYFFFRGSDFL